MRASLRLSSCLLVSLAAVACGNNTPISQKLINMAGGGGTGTAGSGTTTGAAGSGTTAGTAGSGTTTGAAGGGILGVAGSPGPGTGGAAGTATSGAAGTSPVGPGGASGQGGETITMCVSPTTPTGTCVAGAFKRQGVCACQDGAPCVCVDRCTDLLTDDDNCGVCGHRCGPTSTCQVGKCGPEVVNVVAASPGCQSMDLASSNGTLYWADVGHGIVRKMPIATGVISTVAAAEKAPSKIAVSGSSVFWISASNSIRRSVAGGLPADVVDAPSAIGGFVLSPDGATLYFSSGTTVSSVSSSGGTPVVVAREERGGIPRALTFAGKFLAFPTELNGDVDAVTLVPGQVASCGAEDGMGNLLNLNCVRLARSQGELFLDAILSTPSEAIWADGQNVKSEVIGQTSAAFDSVAMSNDNMISGFAMGNNVYFSEDSSSPQQADGVIYRSPPVRDSVALRIARGQSGPRALAVGEGKLYWSTARCTIESTGL